MFGCLRLEPVDFQTALDGFVSSALYQGVVIPELRPSTISTDGPLSSPNVEPSSGVPSSGNAFWKCIFLTWKCILDFLRCNPKEFHNVTWTWGKHKSAGPGGVSYEALRALIAHDAKWKLRLLDVFSDALYMAHLPSSSASLTVLLAKTLQPSTWGQTRPITLSSVMLKVFSQLLLGRCRHLLLLDENGIQWAEKGKQTRANLCPPKIREDGD